MTQNHHFIDLAPLAGPLFFLFALACNGPSDSDDTAVFVSPYAGGWPVNPDKDALGDAPWDTPMLTGTQIPRWVARDQFGEDVELYDFANQGIPIVLERVLPSNLRCQALGDLLAGRPNVLAEERPALTDIAGVLERGEVWWVRVLGGTRTGGLPTVREAEYWAGAYDVAKSPVMIDPEGRITDMFARYEGETGNGGVPTLALIDPATMRVSHAPADSLQNIETVIELASQ